VKDARVLPSHPLISITKLLEDIICATSGLTKNRLTTRTEEEATQKTGNVSNSQYQSLRYDELHCIINIGLLHALVYKRAYQ
jgi:hypothetical protein